MDPFYQYVVEYFMHLILSISDSFSFSSYRLHRLGFLTDWLFDGLAANWLFDFLFLSSLLFFVQRKLHYRSIAAFFCAFCASRAIMAFRWIGSIDFLTFFF